jgi:hypothetical protein
MDCKLRVWKIESHFINLGKLSPSYKKEIGKLSYLYKN